MNSRYIKTLIFSANKDEIQSMESRINTAVNVVKTLGGKVISHYAVKHGISPSFLIHTIVYERESEITETEYEKTVEKISKNASGSEQ